MVEVKICGINEPLALQAAVEGGADWVGFVFFPPSPRAVEPERAGRLAALLPPGGPLPAGLFVAPEDAAIAAVLDRVPLRALQIHDVSAERAASIQARFGLPVWRAIGVASAADLPREAAGHRRLLLDRKPGAADLLPGGNAQRFDWEVLRGWTAPLPWMLAGGLSPESVGAAIRATGAPGVDVSSGVERERGRKDPALIRAFIDAARRG